MKNMRELRRSTGPEVAATRWMRGVLPVLLIAAVAFVPVEGATAAGGCTVSMSAVACENLLPGNPSSEWDVGDGDTDVEGFATDISVNVGATIGFKVNSSGSFTIDIYRLGYYQGNGARKVTTLTAGAAHVQPSCLSDAATGLVDCGNWSTSRTWSVPATAVTGVYFAKFTRTDNQDVNMAPFVVRNDASHADIAFQTSDTTWQAYNGWGGNSLYHGNPVGRAYKVSYNRPFDTRGGTPEGRDFVFANEYPTIRWLEQNGYDISYQSEIDTDRFGSLLRNHKTFLSVGHDEYWSGAQRANVEAARDAGVNLAFLSGNEVYWKTRYEPSIDGSNTNYRTLVSYKETQANAKIDPNPAWTGTWRDPRFSPPADGGRPENALTGTMYMANCCNTNMLVPSEDGKMRFWRNTSVQALPAGQTATLAPNTLGYEFDETPDNGFQPAGLVPLSTTTVATPEYLQDYGSQVLAGTATHHLSLYRAPSGALVFGAGTVQWAWGLDENHDGPTAPADVRMQQATMNILADMATQPTTPQAGLVASPASTDHTAPVATIATPAAGATIDGVTPYAITGTATDGGGGRVGAVEVSTDNGATWHPATGRGTWSYAWSPSGVGSVTILVRATDDSGNIQNPPASVTVTQRCPCSILAGKNPPTQPPSNDGAAVSVGVKFRSDADGFIAGVRFWKESGNGRAHTGSLWSATGTRMATGTFSNESATGWQTLTFAQPVAVNAATTYVASYYAPQGRYTGTIGGLTNTLDRPPLHALSSGTSGGNGVYVYGADGFPTGSYGAANYWVDPVFTTTVGNDTTPPTAQPASPAAGATAVPVTSAAVVTFSEPVVSSSVQMTLTPASGTPVAATVVYDNQTLSATLTPTASLSPTTTYTVRVSGVVDLAGNAMTNPLTWSFTTSANASGCPCTLFGSRTPATAAANDPSAVALGVKFTSDVDGTVTGVRFYKGTGNGGAHTGSLWSSAGTRLATGTFTAESATGWQTLTFAQPVQINAHTTYIASYFAPQGNYATNASFFTTATDSPPLHAPSNATSGGNGVYVYGADAFPTGSYGATNYWVDPVFLAGAPTPLTAQATTPTPGSTGASINTVAVATFNKAVQAGSIQFTLTPPSGPAVAGGVTYDSQSFATTFTPSAPLATNTTYTAQVAAALDTSGQALSAPVTWTFTTTSDTTGCPCTLFGTTAPAVAAANDPAALTLGVKLRSDVAGTITGVRFYKGTGNDGPHTGSLWSASGTRLATGTFAGETATGWQTLTFAQPVTITANTTYIASYFAPHGHYAASGGFFNSALDRPPLHAPTNAAAGGNGVYVYGSDAFPNNNYGATNYWVDATLQVSAVTDSTPPVATPVSPAPSATNIAITTAVVAGFSEPVVASSIQFTLTPASGPAVSGTIGYDTASATTTFTPAASLAASTSYTATVSGAKDLAGNTMVPRTWSFTTAADTLGCPCTLFGSSLPANPAANDPSAVALGLKFQSDTAGFITGVRFYKGTGNGGTHTGSLWSSSGTRLATGTFTSETATGWQSLTFATPVAITATTTYVVSYFAPQGNYAASGGFFASPADKAPLHAPANATSANGVYVYGADAFPNNSYNATNYWVDPIFARS